MSEQAQQAEQDVTQPVTRPIQEPIPWIHDSSLSVSQLVAGPWTALIADPIETPPAIRLAGRYLVRGLLRHASGRSLSKDFPGNTSSEATLEAQRWVMGSIRMWLEALHSAALEVEPIVHARQLPQDLGMGVIQAAFDSLKVSQAKGHLPSNTPVGIDAMQPQPLPIPKKGKRRKRMRRKGR